MKLRTLTLGELEFEGLTPAGLPALRLISYHCPDLPLKATIGPGHVMVNLRDIDLSPSFSHEINIDRAQLAKLGG